MRQSISRAERWEHPDTRSLDIPVIFECEQRTLWKVAPSTKDGHMSARPSRMMNVLSGMNVGKIVILSNSVRNSMPEWIWSDRLMLRNIRPETTVCVLPET
jgi:hypothetical protein